MFERVICVNPLMAQMFEKFGVPGRRLRVIPAFSFEEPEPATPLPQHLQSVSEKYDPLLLTIGQLEKEYDVESQIEAFDSIAAQFSRAGLIIVGSGSEESYLRDLIRSRGFSERIYLAGNVEHRDVLNLISKAKVLLRTTKYDGDAISIREALHLGTPVIATQNEMRPDGVELINMPANAVELAAKAKEVLGR
jgi:glycosyltransferase involved in cell wall biosynthesis